MGTDPAGISDADWLAWPADAREIILDQQRELRAQQEEIDQLRAQLTALATELAGLRERIGRNSRNSSKPPSSDGLGHRCAEDLRSTSSPPAAKAVAASGVGSRGIPEQGRSSCRSSALTRWSNTTLTPAAAAAPCCRVTIRRPIGTR